MTVAKLNTANDLRKPDNAQQHIVCPTQQLPLVYAALSPRFQRKIEFLENGCWKWTGATHHLPGYPHHAYGVFAVKATKPVKVAGAHRYAYETCVGPIPSHLEIDHICHNKLCVNPGHLQLATHFDNCQRRPRVGRIPKRLGGR